MGAIWHGSNGRWLLRITIAIVIALILLLLSVAHVRATKADAAAPVVYTQNSCTTLRSQPTIASPPVAAVIGGTGMHVTGSSSDGLWYQVSFLGEVNVWVVIASVAPTPPDAVDAHNRCVFPGVADSYGDTISSAPGPYPLQAAGAITQPTELRASPAPDARVTAAIVPGQRAFVTQYAGDANGDIWYLAHVQGQLGWLWAYAIRFDGPDPATHVVNGKPLWSVAAGKGMWFTNDFLRHTDINAFVAAAKAAGITHLYPEVAISTAGFYGQESLNRLVPAAHAAGIAVIAWVYPYLNNVAADLALTKEVVDYRTPSGDKADGISADIEERTDAPAVYAYGQVLRQMVGPDTILVVTPYNPRARPSYPFPEVAASFNVIAPQDYWHSNNSTTYTEQQPRALLLLTISTIRAELGGKAFPIEELGQMYTMPSGTPPSSVEIGADMQAAKEFGCIGVSYFEWQTATPDELDTFNTFKW